MPLTKIQADVMRRLAGQRDPESYVAGGAPLNLVKGRYSTDIDMFHDRADRVQRAALGDGEILRRSGYAVEWIRQQQLIYTASVSDGAEITRLEWVVDSDFRFFPVVPDPTFGYVLHPVDLATNKIMAAAGRGVLRDLIDLLTIHETILPLGAVVWAAVEKAPGFTPESLIAEVRRNLNFPRSEWRALSVAEPVDPIATSTRLRRALEDAEAFAMQMPTDLVGVVFLKEGKVVQPEPGRLQDYQQHRGQRRGHWPGSSEVMSAMLESYREGQREQR